MTRQQLEELAKVVNKDIESLVKNDEELIFLSVFLMNLIGFCLSLPTHLFRQAPSVLRILANALDVMIASSDGTMMHDNNDEKRH